MKPDTAGRWRVRRVATSEGQKHYWELVALDGKVLDRVPINIPVLKGHAGDESQPPIPPEAAA